MEQALLAPFSAVLAWEARLNRSSDLQSVCQVLMVVSSVSGDDLDILSCTRLREFQSQKDLAVEVEVYQLVLAPVAVDVVEALVVEVKASQFQQILHCEQTLVGDMDLTRDILGTAEDMFLMEISGPTRCCAAAVEHSLLDLEVLGSCYRIFSYQAEV